MRNLPGSGIKPMSPALADRFLITQPPGKPALLSWTFLPPHPTHLGCHKALVWVPWIIHLLFLSFFMYFRFCLVLKEKSFCSSLYWKDKVVVSHLSLIHLHLVCMCCEVWIWYNFLYKHLIDLVPFSLDSLSFPTVVLLSVAPLTLHIKFPYFQV